MKRWPIKSLSELCSVVDERATVGESPYLEIGNLDSKTKKYEFTGKPAVKGALATQADDIIVSRVRPTRGAITLLHEKRIAVSSAFTVLRARQEIRARFLYFALAWNDTFLIYLGKRSKGALYPTVSEIDVLAFEIPVPPIAEQERIVKLLDEAEELRKLRSQADLLAADIIPALYHEMFGDPEVNQNNWPRVKVKDAVDLINGRAFKPTEWNENGLPIIRIQNLKNATANFNLYNGPFDPKHHVKNGALLISWAGQLVSFGVHIWDGPEGVLNQHIFKVEPRMTFEIPFLKHALSYVVERAKSQFQGIEMKHLTRGTLDEAEILSPPLSLQIEFAQRVNEIRELEAAQAVSRQRVEHLFQSMLHRAFNQEL